MKLELEINQAKFRNIYHHGTVNMIYSFNWLLAKQSAFFAKEDLTYQQFNILRILRGSMPKPLSTIQLRERMLDKMSDTSRLVARLETKGLVLKKQSSTDKRLVEITISRKGQNVLSRLDKVENELDQIIKNLTEVEVKTLNNLLDKMRSEASQ